jgi:hypothetical protein
VCLAGLFDEEDSVRAHDTNASEKVVYLQPCRHYFHKKCILKWHNGNRCNRDLCPVCRCLLFLADDLTPTQIDRLAADELPPNVLDYEWEVEFDFDVRIFGTHRRPRPDEVLVNWECYTMDMLARKMIETELRNSRLDIRGEDWLASCKSSVTRCWRLVGACGLPLCPTATHSSFTPSSLHLQLQQSTSTP